MRKRKILIDAGHGFSEKTKRYERPLMFLDEEKNEVKIVPNSMSGTDKDYLPGYYREDHGTLLIAMETIKVLSDLGYDPYCTRSNRMDSLNHLETVIPNVTKYQKKVWQEHNWIQAAGEFYKPAAFVSIHTNAGRGEGVSCFYRDEEVGKDFAKEIASNVKEVMDSNIRRIKLHKYAILRNMAEGLACLIECGFHDNPKELKKLIDPTYQKLIGQSIANAIDNYFRLTSK